MTSAKRGSRTILAAIAVSLCALVIRPAAAEQRPPNIVLIVSDDQGYHDLGMLNPELISPNLDRLVREGVRLTDFSVAWPACTPSRGAFLTGRYPQRNGLYDMIRNEAPDYGHRYTPEEYAVTWERIGGMDTREVLLPQVLQQAGYRCGVFGKWDMGMSRRYLPLQRGFDDFYGFVNSGIDYFTHERYGVHAMYEGNSPTRDDQGTYCTELFEREALRFIRENHDRPFFLYLPFNAPHGASSLDPAVRGAAQAPEEYKRLYPHLADELVEGSVFEKTAFIPSRSKRKLEYLASITCMDAAIGSVLDALDEFELADCTMVVFFSDNGGAGQSDNGPLRGSKGTTFEGGIRVCACVRYPARIPAGTVCDEFLTSLELFPTLTALAGVEPPANLELDGFDMLPVVAGEAATERTEMFWKRREHEAARVGHWKWVRNGRGTFLFDLSSDVGESDDRAEAEPEITARLQGRFDEWLGEMEAAEPRGPFRDY